MYAVTPPKLGREGRIVEGVMTTLSEDGEVNISPLGPIADATFSVMVLRPFQGSRTHRSLIRQGRGVFHVTDDVDLIAKAAVGALDTQPRTIPAKSIDGRVLADACRWFELEVEEIDDSQQRSNIVARTVSSGWNRDFLGFNRAQAAVVEAAILASRTHVLRAEEIMAALESLKLPVKKTGGSVEIAAFDFLCQYIDTRISRYKDLA